MFLCSSIFRSISPSRTRISRAAYERLKQQTRHLSTTTLTANMPSESNTDGAQSKPLKILMLHGYTQNGPLFHAKTKALDKFLQKHFPGASLIYPTGPLRLKPSDVPGFDMTKFDSEDDVEAYGWWRRSDTSNPPEYTGLEEGLSAVAGVLSEEGPVDGVMGFSQGAALAGMVASLLDPGRKEAFQKAKSRSKFAMDYPESFARLQHPPLKFSVSYSGFIAPGERYAGFYEDPLIQTEMMHFIGSVDSVIEESRVRKLVDAAGGQGKTKVVVHPGGHFVPSGKQYLEIVAGFIKETTHESGKKEEQEESVEDMDVPF